MQAGKILKINVLAGWNKAMQIGLFYLSLMKINVSSQKFPKSNKRVGWNKAVQVGIFQKIDKFCSMNFRETSTYQKLQGIE